jgi:hypothetical protein
MNELVNYLLKNDNFPILFSFKDFEKIGYKKDEFNKYLSEGMTEKYIDCVYGNIYALESKYRKKVIPKGTLAQMIIPDSYISTYYVLRDYDWIPEMIFSITSVTNGNNCIIDTNGYGAFIYTNLNRKFPVSGIYTEDNFKGKYKIAKPLRALCDLMYFMKKEWKNIDSLYEALRIDKDSLEETLTSNDFDELQGTFGIESIENFLQGIREELNL